MSAGPMGRDPGGRNSRAVKVRPEKKKSGGVLSAGHRAIHRSRPAPHHEERQGPPISAAGGPTFRPALVTRRAVASVRWTIRIGRRQDVPWRA